MARSKEQIRLKAEQYYIENITVSQAEIAELFGVRAATIGEWVKKYDWEEKRLSFHASPTLIKQKLQAETIRIMNGEEATFSADAVAKLMAALDRCNAQLDPIVISRLLKELDLFISQTDPAFAIECTKYHKQFLQHKINENE
jgi:putative ATPase subunit of terminase (gpP-like)|nr:MAG TPA: Protein of unknown function (DUF1804) [Caudoviricetes sp.]